MIKSLRAIKSKFVRSIRNSVSQVPALDVLTISHHGNHFLLLRNDAIAQHLQRGDEWEPHFGRLVKLLVRPGDQVLDIGANFGYHTVTLAKQVGPHGKVLSFEPLRVIFQQLCANVFVNRLGNVYAFNRAVAEISGRDVEMNPVDFEAAWVNVGDTRVGSGGDRVKTLAVDDLNLQSVSFVKLDIQGYELFALKGAEATFSRFRPFIFVEIEEPHLRAFDCSSKQLMELLLNSGYDLLRIHTDYPCDHLAIPRERSVSTKDIEACIGYRCELITGRSVDLTFTDRFGGATYERCVTHG